MKKSVKSNSGDCKVDLLLEQLDIPENIEIMMINDYQFSDLSFLYRFKGLKGLYIDYLHESDVLMSELHPLVNIRKIGFSNYEITKIENLDRLTSLEWLSLTQNQIIKMEGLDVLISLKVLDLTQNRICTIGGLKNLVKLEELSLDENQLFQDAEYVSRAELIKYIGHPTTLNDFNRYKFPLPDRIFLS